MKKILQGIGTSIGKATGKAKIIRDIKDYAKFNKGDVLVTRLTDPTMVPMMSKASAIVCEIGGLTSHPSIVSREMGIPCIVSVKDATNILKDDDLIEVCGKTGKIHKIE